MTIAFDDTNVAKYASSTSLVESRHSIQTSLFTYQRRVSFDNVASISPTFNSYTLKQSSQGFERTKRSRTFMVVIDLLRINNEENTKIQDPLIFTLMNLIDEGDEVVVVAVHSSFNYPYSDRDISPKQKAKEIMNWIVESHQGDNINMVVELTFGRPEVVLEEMTRMYQPSMVVVSACNRTKYKHAYSGAGIFKYRLKHTYAPVAIVRDRQTVIAKPDVLPPSANFGFSKLRAKWVKWICKKES